MTNTDEFDDLADYMYSCHVFYIIIINFFKETIRNDIALTDSFKCLNVLFAVLLLANEF